MSTAFTSLKKRLKYNLKYCMYGRHGKKCNLNNWQTAKNDDEISLQSLFFFRMLFLSFFMFFLFMFMFIFMLTFMFLFILLRQLLVA
jgi:hypothetical protein